MKTSQGTSAESDQSVENQHHDHGELMTNLRSNSAIYSQLCLHRDGKHHPLSRISIGDLLSWDKDDTLLGDLYSIADLAKRCPKDTFPSVSTCYPPGSSISERLARLTTSIIGLMKYRDSIIHRLPLDYGRNTQFRETRSKIHSLLDIAFASDEYQKSKTSGSDALSVLSADQLKSLDHEQCAKIARELSDGIQAIRSTGLVEEWFNLATLKGIEAGIVNGEGEGAWHRHPTGESAEV